MKVSIFEVPGTTLAPPGISVLSVWWGGSGAPAATACAKGPLRNLDFFSVFKEKVLIKLQKFVKDMG